MKYWWIARNLFFANLILAVINDHAYDLSRLIHTSEIILVLILMFFTRTVNPPLTVLPKQVHQCCFNATNQPDYTPYMELTLLTTLETFVIGSEKRDHCASKIIFE